MDVPPEAHHCSSGRDARAPRGPSSRRGVSYEPPVRRAGHLHSREAATRAMHVTATAYGFPNVAMRSIRHSNSTRFSSIAGSRSP